MKSPISRACFLLLAAAIPCAAQEAPPQRPGCDTVAVGGTIRGVVRDDSTNRPSARQLVHIPEAIACRAITDSLGRFQIDRVPAGRYTVEVPSSRRQRLQVFGVEVQAGSVIELEFRLREQNDVADCLRLERCAALLAPEAGLVASLSDAERLEEAAWRTGIALAGWYAGQQWVPCADIENPRVREALAARVPSLAPTSQCAWTEASRPEDQLSRRIIHQPTGNPARRMRLTGVEQTPQGAVARVSHIAGTLAAAGRSCRFIRKEGQWIAEWCVTTTVA